MHTFKPCREAIYSRVKKVHRMSNLSNVSSTAFAKLSEVSEQIMATPKRLKKMDLAGGFLKELQLKEVEAAALLLIGRPFPRTSQRTLDLDWSALYQVLQELLQPPTNLMNSLYSESGDTGEVVRQLYMKSGKIRQVTLVYSPLTILEVFQTFIEIADVQGPGSRKRKTALLRALFTRATPLEAKYLAKTLIGDQRIGFSEGMLESTLARTLNLPLDLIRRANMLTGNIGEVARIAIDQGQSGLQVVQLRPFTPLLPMLAAQAQDIADVMAQHGGESAFEWKLDGARVQIHMDQTQGKSEIRIFSRRLTDVTKSLPDIIELVEKNVQAQSCILEGEVIATSYDGRPLPFQHLMRRFRRVRDVELMISEIPVSLSLFDLIMLNGEVLIDIPYSSRRKQLATVCGSISLVNQLVSSEIGEVTTFFEQSVHAGHEGLVAKRLDSFYQPGVRGKAWLKVKRSMETLDLVIIAAEWGTGRRHKWLSDYHLGARDPETGGYQMLGKTFKGLTDAEFQEITDRLLELKIDQRRGIVTVHPRIVVEVEYDEIQRSPRYKSGMALRFARIKRIRYDKDSKDADTIHRVIDLFESQFQRKASSNRIGRT